MSSFDFTKNSNDELTIDEAVFQAIGAASVCWENMEGAGIFDSDRAKDIGDKLLAFIELKATEIEG